MRITNPNCSSKMLSLLACSLLGFSSVSGEGQEAVPDASRAKRLDDYFANLVSAQKYVGLGACLLKDGRVVWQNCYGFADLDPKQPVRTNHIFQIASLSKTMTATALMQLHEKGMFQLDDDVNRYLPFKFRNPAFPDKPITFRMLVTHTSGLEDVTHDAKTGVPTGNKLSFGVLGDSPIPLAVFVEDILKPGGKRYSKDYFSSTEPGTKYEYSNLAYSLIGYLVEKLAKEDFAAYCREHIFKPLEMADTGWHLRDLDTNRIVFPYGFSPGNPAFATGAVSVAAYRKVQHFGLPGYPEGMLRTTLADFGHFVSLFMQNGRYGQRQVLKPETVELMLCPQGIKNIPSRGAKVTDIGLPWLLVDFDGRPIYSMDGFQGSIFASAQFSVPRKTAVVFYFTGISMKNMAGVAEIRKTLWRELDSY